MEPRERWQALQARLAAARAAADAGDRATALSEITAALDLDKDFLAAQALRDRIVTTTTDASSAEPAPPEPARIASSPAIPPIGATERPVISPDYAKFEDRARRRRVDRRIAAARAALDQQRLNAAATALDEVIELDPSVPELAGLTARFDALRRVAAKPHRGPSLAAAAVFAGAMLGGTWLQDSSALLSRPTVAVASLPAPAAPIATMTERPGSVGTTGEAEMSESPQSIERPAVMADVPTIPVASSLRLPTVAVEPPPPVLIAETTHAMAEPAAAVVPVVTSPPEIEDAADDNLLVKQALQRYRTAYEGLDAESAQAVWPAVNEAALARAFDGLESQFLTFDACDIRLRGEAATATCRGSARYVPKIGNRDPRVEPRVWNFTLHKAGNDWKIESARAER